MEPVYFPHDVRHDITFYGLKLSRIWIPIAGLIFAIAIFAVDIPLIGIMSKMFLLIAIPVALFLFFVLDLGGVIKKMKKFSAEPAVRLPDSRGGNKSVQDLCGIQAGAGPFFIFPRGYLGVVLTMTPPPWEVLTHERRSTVVSAYQAALARTVENNAMVSVYIDFDLELPRAEIERKAMEWRSRFPVGSGLREIAEARLDHFMSGISNVKPVSIVRILWRPVAGDLPRRPRNKEEKETFAAMVFSDMIETFVAELAQGGIATRVLGPEAVRDHAARQLNPADWRRIAPVSGTDWESRYKKQGKPREKQDNAQSKKQSYSKGITGALQKTLSKGQANCEDTCTDTGSTINGSKLIKNKVVFVTTFEPGLDVSDITLHLVHAILREGMTLSLIDADSRYPGRLNELIRTEDIREDWRVADNLADAAVTPTKGVVYWGLSSHSYSIAVDHSQFSRVIDEAAKWSHIVLVHLGDNQEALTLAESTSIRVVAITNGSEPVLGKTLRFSRLNACLVAPIGEVAASGRRNYHVKRCLVLDNDNDELVDFAIGRRQD